MTFSIVARCVRSGQFGVAAGTELPAVGKLLAYASAGAGAVATQGTVNPYLGIDGVRLLTLEGKTARDVMEEVLSRDPAAQHRQLALVDRHGGFAQWTGRECKPWAGERRGADFAVQGNLLEGPEVLDAAAASMEASGDQPLVERLFAALVAGEAKGGDRRGTRSATILVMEKNEYPLWDVRVDDHPQPMEELRRLMVVFAESLVPMIRHMPNRDGGRYTTGLLPD